MDNKLCVWFTETQENVKCFLSDDYKSIFFSLQKIFYIPVKISDEILSSERKVLVFTSRHATEILSSYSFDKEVLIGCVGKITAQEVISKGFKNIFYPKVHNALNLHQEILKKVPKNFLVIHFSGHNIRFNIAQALEKKGFISKRFIVYKTVNINFLSKEIQEEIKKRAISHISFSSVGAFLNFERLMDNYSLDCRYMTAICMSNYVADVCKKYFEKIIINQNIYKNLQ